METQESLLLKWGTLKGWENITDDNVEIIKRYFEDGMPIGCLGDRPDEKRKEILCELIDSIDGEIQEDWGGKILNKEEAKKYVREY